MKLPQIDTIRDTLKVIYNQGLYRMHSKIIKNAKHNKVFDEGSIDGYNVAAIDGTKLFGSYKKNCKECCMTTVRNRKTKYFHSAVFMSLIGKEPRLIMDFELYKGSEDSSKKDEGELTVAKRLLTRVCKNYKNTLDVVIYDALEHCLVHHANAIEAILYLMSIATNLTQLFIFRRLTGNEIKLLTQKEIIRLLEKELYLLRYNR